MFRLADPSLCEGAIIRTVPVHCAPWETLHAARWQRGLPPLPAPGRQALPALIPSATHQTVLMGWIKGDDIIVFISYSAFFECVAAWFIMPKWGLGSSPQQAKPTEKPLALSVGFSHVWPHMHCLLKVFVTRHTSSNILSVSSMLSSFFNKIISIYTLHWAGISFIHGISPVSVEVDEHRLGEVENILLEYQTKLLQFRRFYLTIFDKQEKLYFNIWIRGD